MTGTVDINVFMEELERKGLVIAPRNLVESRLQERKLEEKQRAAWNKKALSYKEIADARLWGEVGVKAVKVYAKKYAKPGEIFPVKKGKIIQEKLIRAAVERLAKKRGYAPNA